MGLWLNTGLLKEVRSGLIAEVTAEDYLC